MRKRRKIRVLSPSYREDKDRNCGVAVWKCREGKVRKQTLPGVYNSPESRTAFAKLRAEVKASATGRPARERGITVPELLSEYLKWAETYYCTASGKPTSEMFLLRPLARALCARFPDTPAARFGPLCLQALVAHLVAEKLSRTGVNTRCGRVKRIFKWAVARQLVGGEVYQALACVPGLRRGKTNARETEPVRPVDDATVDATVPHLGRHVAAMVQLQRLTGMRPGEVCLIRRCDIDTGSVDPRTGLPVWVYRPSHHKTAHRDRDRYVLLPPPAQELLKQFFTADPTAYLFRPRAAVRERCAERSAARKTPLFPSHKRRNKAKRKRRPQWKPGERYNHNSYALAVRRACAAAFPAPGLLERQEGETVRRWKARLTPEQRAELLRWRQEHQWHPHQIRHTFATEVRKRHGLEAAQVLLGHADADVTQRYAEKNLDLGLSVVARIGEAPGRDGRNDTPTRSSSDENGRNDRGEALPPPPAPAAPPGRGAADQDAVQRGVRGGEARRPGGGGPAQPGRRYRLTCPPGRPVARVAR